MLADVDPELEEAIASDLTFYGVALKSVRGCCGRLKPDRRTS